MADGARTGASDGPRVVARTQRGGAGEERRRRFQKHLAGFGAAVLATAGLDLVASPGLQWVQWLAGAWAPLIVVHALALRTRGFTLVELVTPPRSPQIVEELAVPLEYELVRSRQLRDGLAHAAAAIRESDGQLAEETLAVADEVSSGVETLVHAARGDGTDADTTAREDARSTVEPVLADALDALDELHAGVLAVEVLDQDADAVPIERARGVAERLRQLAEELSR